MGRETNTPKPDGGREIPVAMDVQDPAERVPDGPGPLPPYAGLEADPDANGFEAGNEPE